MSLSFQVSFLLLHLKGDIVVSKSGRSIFFSIQFALVFMPGYWSKALERLDSKEREKKILALAQLVWLGSSEMRQHVAGLIFA